MRKLFSTLLLLCTITMFAQGPNNISVESCTDEALPANGTYTKGIPTGGCDCYNYDGGNGRITYSNQPSTPGGFFYEAGKSCDGTEPDLEEKSTVLIRGKATDCNNILAGASPWNCIVLESQPIPTLSEWAIIILSLLMLIVGVKAVYTKIKMAV